MALRVSDLVNADASLVSRRCWSDPQVYELEKRGIFGKAWLFLGHESQLPEPRRLRAGLYVRNAHHSCPWRRREAACLD